MATSCLQGEAFSWWQNYSGAARVTDWPTLREALKVRFNPLIKVQAARDLLHMWKQTTDVASYKKSFQSIILDIPDITMTEQIDRYSRGLKGYIWETQSLKQYETLDAIMLDALKVEAAKRGVRRVPTPTMLWLHITGQPRWTLPTCRSSTCPPKNESDACAKVCACAAPPRDTWPRIAQKPEGTEA